MFLREVRAWSHVASMLMILIVAVGMTACGDSGDDGGSNGGGAAADSGNAASEADTAASDAQPAATGDSAEITQVVTDFQKAGTEGDAKAVCDSLSAAYRKSLMKRSKGQSCEKSFAPILDNRIKGTVPKVTAVKITGEGKAIVSYKGDSVAGKVKALKENGEWKVDLGEIKTVLDTPGPDAPPGLKR